MNASEVRGLLNNRIEEVMARLLPGGKRKGAEWCAGSVGGEAGDSLKVHLVGEKTGVWRDFASGGDDAGDIFTLWQKVRGVDFVGALKQAHEFLGLKDEKEQAFFRQGPPKKTYVRPVLDQIEPMQSGGPVFDYLTKERQLDPAVLERYKVRQMVSDNHGVTAVFYDFEPSGNAVDMVKYLAVRRGEGGRKTMWTSKDSKAHLFGWQAMDGNAREVVITEGEIDCLTVAGWGVAALSLPMGTNGMEWIEHDFEALERFEKIYVCTDMDEPGQKAAAEMAQRLGRERCYRVVLPGKDANEAQLSGKFCGPDFLDCMAAAKTMDPHELKGASEFSDAGWEDLHPTSQKTAGTQPPVNLNWRCRFGELSIWTGWSGHGKSHLLNQFCIHDSAQGEKVCLASFEMPPGATVRQLACMAAARTFVATDRAGFDESVRWLDGRFWLVNHVGVMHWTKVIPLFRYAAQRYGCSRFVADSLLRMGVAEDDYEGQKECVAALIEFAAKYGHVHLVCHSRKGEDESQPPGKLDVRGAAAITDLCHNGFTVWRNKKKEQKIEMAMMDKEPEVELRELGQLRDAQIAMWKNRKTGEEPFCSLWLEKKSGQFLDSRYGEPFKYLFNGVQPR